MLCDVLCVYNLLPEHRCRICGRVVEVAPASQAAPPAAVEPEMRKNTQSLSEFLVAGRQIARSLFFRDVLILLQQHSEHPQVSRIWTMSSSYELTEADRILGRCNSMASEWTPGWHLRDRAVCSVLLQNLDNLVWVVSCECGDISMMRHHQYGEGSTWKPRRKSSLSGFVSKRKRGNISRDIEVPRAWAILGWCITHLAFGERQDYTRFDLRNDCNIERDGLLFLARTFVSWQALRQE